MSPTNVVVTDFIRPGFDEDKSVWLRIENGEVIEVYGNNSYPNVHIYRPRQPDEVQYLLWVNISKGRHGVEEFRAGSLFELQCILNDVFQRYGELSVGRPER